MKTFQTAVIIILAMMLLVMEFNAVKNRSEKISTSDPVIERIDRQFDALEDQINAGNGFLLSLSMQDNAIRRGDTNDLHYWKVKTDQYMDAKGAAHVRFFTNQIAK